MKSVFSQISKFFSKVTRLAAQFAGLFPSRLPLGMDDFYSYSKSITSAYDLPTNNQRDVDFVIANEIIRLRSQVTHVPKFYFVKAIRHMSAKQIAGEAFNRIKEEQKEIEKQLKLQAEATAQKAEGGQKA